ncbi:MAG: hypothetical protein WC881_12210 [Elusimicrobiota bacterium]|jgi:hypothetical protein
MRNDRGRHPLFEGVVFGLALLLAGIILFYSAQRYVERRARPAPAAADAPASAPGDPGAVPLTERAVASIPPVRLVQTGSLRSRNIDVPAPLLGKENACPPGTAGPCPPPSPKK